MEKSFGEPGKEKADKTQLQLNLHTSEVEIQCLEIINEVQSDIVFVSAESKTESAFSSERINKPLGSTATKFSRGSLSSSGASEGITINPQVTEKHVLLNGNYSFGKPTQGKIKEVSGSHLPLQSVPRLKVGPPPCLLPLDQNLSSKSPKPTCNSQDNIASENHSLGNIQVPPALNSEKKQAEMLGKQSGVQEGINITVHKVKDPNFEKCRACKKMESCAFKTIGKNSESFVFCSKKCIQRYYSSDKINFTFAREVDGRSDADKHVIALRDSVQDHIVIEPDIEIQTLSDEFQMEFEDSEINSANNEVSIVFDATTIEKIERAARETLCCVSCRISLYSRTDTLLWEAMEFCSEKCLKTYVKVIGSHCNMCNSQVGEHNLGKLCVRFGTVIRQFCSAECLEKFKVNHKLCAQCQINMPDKEKVHCSTRCEELARRLVSKEEFFGKRMCAVCNELKPIREEIYLSDRSNWLCSKPCRNAFRFANKLITLSCDVCNRCFDINVTPRYASRNMDSGSSSQPPSLIWYCSKVCFATHLLKKRKIELCARCQVKKYNVDMIRKPTGDTNSDKSQASGQIFFCSIYCYTHYSLPPQRDVARRKALDASHLATTSATSPALPVTFAYRVPASGISNHVQAPTSGRSMIAHSSAIPTTVTALSSNTTPIVSTNPAGGSGFSVVPVELQHKVIFVPSKPKEMKNKAVWCRPAEINQSSKAEETHIEKPSTVESSTDTDRLKDDDRKPLYIPIPIPIPVPIYVPVPMAMYNFPAPFPVGFPVPFVTPIVCPIDRSLLEKVESTQENDKNDSKETPESETQSVEEIHPSDVNLLKSNRENLERRISENNSNQQNVSSLADITEENILDSVDIETRISSTTFTFSRNTGRKRSHSTSHSSGPLPKRLKEVIGNKCSSDSEETSTASRTNRIDPDIKGGFQIDLGMSAWRNWMKQKHHRQIELNDMNVEEMNSALTSFIRDIRKPDGEKYRPDVLLYLICGLQECCVGNLHRMNLLMEDTLLPFHLELDQQLQPFCDALVMGIKSNSTMEVTTSLKESHFWECRQLGVDSPIVLVFTMLYFNTKYFRLYTAEQHEQLSFTNIQKYPRKVASTPVGMLNGSSGKDSAKGVSLQYVPAIEQGKESEIVQNIHSKTPYEMPQNINQPSRCPIKHYEFYLSKCPESVKNKEDLFYLLPEKSSLPESPVWYSTNPVPRELLARMLRRVLLIDEVLRNLCSPG